MPWRWRGWQASVTWPSAFQVEGYQQLEAWCDWLAAEGVEHTSITYLDQFDMSALVFRDPDNLQLALTTYGSAPDPDGGGRPGGPPS